MELLYEENPGVGYGILYEDNPGVGYEYSMGRIQV